MKKIHSIIFSIRALLGALIEKIMEAIYDSPKRIKIFAFIHNGEQSHYCKDCGRQFVGSPENKIISSKSKGSIEKLLLEKIPRAGIARVIRVSEPWLQDYVNKKYELVPRKVKVRQKREVD